MSAITHYLKEAATSAMRAALRGIAGTPPANIKRYLDAVHEQGYAVVDGFWSAEKCQLACTSIELAIRDGSPCRLWTDAIRSDERLYWAERLGGDLAAFWGDQFIRSARKYYSGLSGGDSLLLAARIRFMEGNLGSGGGWHRDSPHRSQFKALMYLTDVTESTGPFEYLDGFAPCKRVDPTFARGIDATQPVPVHRRRGTADDRGWQQVHDVHGESRHDASSRHEGHPSRTPGSRRWISRFAL